MHLKPFSQVAVCHSFPGYETTLWLGVVTMNANNNGIFKIELFHKEDDETFFTWDDTDSIMVFRLWVRGVL